MASSMSDADLQAIIVKESSTRLKAELGVAQKGMDTAAIEVLPRRTLISHIFALRRLAGQSSQIKNEVVGYDPTKLQLLPEEPTLKTPVASTDSTTAMLLSFFQTMNEREERRCREAEEREDRKTRQAEEREDKRRQDEKDKDTADRKERADERALVESRLDQEKEQRLKEYQIRMKDEDERQEKARELAK